MHDPKQITGKAPYGISSILGADGREWELVLFQQGKDVADAEANLAQRIGMERLAQIAEICGDGLFSPLIFVDSASATAVTLHSGSTVLNAMVAGRLVPLRGSTDSLAVNCTLPALPVAGSRTDLVFLEVWFETVQPTGATESASTSVPRRGNTANSSLLSNDLLLTGMGSTETARRVQVRYAIRAIADITSMELASASGYTYTAHPSVPGRWWAGAGDVQAAQALLSVDGYRYAIPLATVLRQAGDATTPAARWTTQARQILLPIDANTADGISASATPVANQLLALDAFGKFPASVFTGVASSAENAESVDGFDASATPVANQLLALNASAKFPNSVLLTGAGNGLNADQVDGIEASATPTANQLLPLNASAKFPNSVFLTGSGNGLNADQVDGLHASSFALNGHKHLDNVLVLFEPTKTNFLSGVVGQFTLATSSFVLPATSQGRVVAIVTVVIDLATLPSAAGQILLSVGGKTYTQGVRIQTGRQTMGFFAIDNYASASSSSLTVQAIFSGAVVTITCYVTFSAFCVAF